MDEDPYTDFKSECEKIVRSGLMRLGLEEFTKDIRLTEPPDPSFGELSTSICFELSKKLKEKPSSLAEKIIKGFKRGEGLVSGVRSVGGYINFNFDSNKATPLIFKEIKRQGDSYGFKKTDEKRSIIVEHTSVNPVHPIHIGQARNSIIGDALARIQRARGHHVKTHYYVDDMGRQTATLAFGYFQLKKKLDESEKIDQFMGKIYTITSSLVEINNLKRRLKEIKDTSSPNEINRLKVNLDEWTAIAAELKAKYPKLFDELSGSIINKKDPESEINDLIVKYEQEEIMVKEKIRELSEKCLAGIRESLSELDIRIDNWDWESDLVWSSKVQEVLDRLLKTPYVHDTGTICEFQTDKIIEKLNLREKLGISPTYHLPSLTLARSDRTTLYATRDIAYSLLKYRQADNVINVIGAEQTLAQLQVKAALLAIGEEDCALHQTHFAFGLVETPGYKMSSRRGRIITLDSVLDEAVARAHHEVTKRSPSLSGDEKRKIAEKIGKAAIKYALISLEPIKTVSFTWDRVLNFERNSAPFINYAYTRACGILRRARIIGGRVRSDVLNHPLERELVIKIAKFPSCFIDAADNLKPQDIAVYANELAEMFHEYYEKVSVVHAETDDLKRARSSLVEAVKTTLENSMRILGIEFTEKM